MPDAMLTSHAPRRYYYLTPLPQRLPALIVGMFVLRAQRLCAVDVVLPIYAAAPRCAQRAQLVLLAAVLCATRTKIFHAPDAAFLPPAARMI